MGAQNIVGMKRRSCQNLFNGWLHWQASVTTAPPQSTPSPANLALLENISGGVYLEFLRKDAQIRMLFLFVVHFIANSREPWPGSCLLQLQQDAKVQNALRAFRLRTHQRLYAGNVLG